MKGENNRNMYIPIILFVLIASAFVGIESITPPTQYQTIHPECDNYFTDQDGDGDNGLIEDSSCWDYPYNDGLGETDTPFSLMGSSGDEYQPYFDLTVDFVRAFINLECGGSLNNCDGTNFQWESQFYCYFSNQIMYQNFGQIFQKFYVTGQILPDDGSFNLYKNICQNLTPPSGLLPTIEYQNSSPISENVGGGSSGK